jgi:hypothetical protein
MEGLRKTTKIFIQDRQSPGKNSNPGPPEYKAGVLIAQPRRWVAVRQFSEPGDTELSTWKSSGNIAHDNNSLFFQFFIFNSVLYYECAVPDSQLHMQHKNKNRKGTNNKYNITIIKLSINYVIVTKTNTQKATSKQQRKKASNYNAVKQTVC